MPNQSTFSEHIYELYIRQKYLDLSKGFISCLESVSVAAEIAPTS